MADFKHHDRNYSLEGGIRKSILDVLGTCIVRENNFQRRLSFMNRSNNASSNDSTQNLPPAW
ncbi:hypothetical protein IQ238_20380 [Pleurocapsales cyanobacterium LEGE 06147]|nr:hypothetical protein [Pleurocapsales cyanobacterium LEGE 06147]